MFPSRIENAIHATTITSNFDYDSLIEDDLIPDIVSDGWEEICGRFTLTSKTRMPPWVLKTKSYDRYGVFIENLLKVMVTEVFSDRVSSPSSSPSSSKRWQSMVEELVQEAFDGEADMKEVNRSYGTYTNMYRWILNPFLGFDPQSIQLSPEYNYDVLTFHPDMVIDDWVADVKTTNSFVRIEKATILQLLSYYAVMRLLQVELRGIVVILPLTRVVKRYDLSWWNTSGFLLKMIEDGRRMYTGDTSTSITSFPVGDVVRVLRVMCTFDGVGSHIKKVKGSILKSLESFYEHSLSFDRPCQMFLRSNRNGTPGTVTEADIEATSQYVTDNGIRFFVHTPYIINLSTMTTMYSHLEEDPQQWCRDVVIDDLEKCARLGGGGVVIHVGKCTDRCGLTIEEGIDSMRENIRYLLSYATEQCPLLLETCAGQKSELCSDIDDFAAFYTSFSEDERRVFGICIDTCHVFACGYDPYEYIVSWGDMVGIDSIKLVHFNNSLLDRGSRRDRHCGFTDGKIPIETMVGVYETCLSYGIPMVHE